MSALQSKYGAVATAVDEENVGHDTQFDSNNTYYLKDTRKWTVHRLILLFVPIVGATLLVGGAVWYLLSDFNHLYPGTYSSDSGDKHSHDDTSKIVQSHENSLSAVGSSSKSLSDSTLQSSQIKDTNRVIRSPGNSSCDAHQSCVTLLGDCCPTFDGVILECCKF